ncbi:MAG TPA: hypothetical protein VH394_14430 [Thermoanaerobaculia bacterium]|jgi:hypothetical protein|nr:hypothetical protein [Thermoanaerobaculia bacterium]
MTESGERRVWAVAAGLAAGLAALWMDLSPIHAFHTSDSLIPILSGLYLWTPFFWEQNRYGSLIPLLSLPIDSPFHNLLFQVGLRLLAVAAAFFLMARAVVPRRYWPAVGALGLALWVAGKGVEDHAFQQMQPYGQAIALSLGGILLIDRGGRVRVAVGLGLLLLGYWISATTLFWLLPLVWVRDMVGIEPESARWRLKPERRTLLVMLALFLAFDLSMLVSWLSQYSRSTAFGAAQPGIWWTAWTTLFSRSVEYLSPALVVAGLVLLVVAIVIGSRSWSLRLGMAAGLCLMTAALADLGVMGTTYWAQVNKWSLRYVSVELLALGLLAPAVLLALLLENRPARWHRVANVLALLLLIPALAWAYGMPSVARARASIDELSGDSEAVLASGANHVLGGYWRTWPTVFRANVLRWERGDRRPVWAIALRSGPTDHIWRPKSWAGVPVAVLAGNEVSAEDMRQIAFLPQLYRKKDYGRVIVYTATPTGGPSLSDVAAAVRNGRPGP